MNINSFDALLFTLLSIVPGYILVNIRNLFTTRRPQKPSEQIISYIVFSVVSHLVFSPVFYMVFYTDIIINNPKIYVFCLCFIFLVGPAFLGWLWGASSGWKWAAATAQRFGTVHHMPTAWDWFFRSQRLGTYLIVTLTNDKKVYGWFGANSMASSENGERDLYLEEIFSLSEDDSWIPQKNGILIPHSQIRFIEKVHNEEQP